VAEAAAERRTVPVDLCNEVVREMDLEAQCDFAAALG
jgi:hypothetical protein